MSFGPPPDPGPTLHELVALADLPGVLWNLDGGGVATADIYQMARSLLADALLEENGERVEALKAIIGRLEEDGAPGNPPDMSAGRRFPEPNAIIKSSARPAPSAGEAPAADMEMG